MLDKSYQKVFFDWEKKNLFGTLASTYQNFGLKCKLPKKDKYTHTYIKRISFIFMDSPSLFIYLLS